MKNFSITLLFALTLAGTGFNSLAQNKVTIRYFNQVRWESQLSYNFFTGPDAGDFSTSVKGFGSGMLDFFDTRSSVDVLSIGTDKLFIRGGAGFAVMKFRLSQNLVFGTSDHNTLTWATDPVSSHNYSNTFFGYGKSKIITTSFFFPVDLNVGIGKKITISAGGYLDLNLTARYKMKYLNGEDKVKEIIRSAEFRNLNPSTTKFGINVSLFHKKPDFGLSASWSITPFFKSGMGPDIHETRISASYSIRKLKEAFNQNK
jgi:hypothetical protein